MSYPGPILPMSRGGSGANLTPDAGGVIYSTASAMGVLAHTATSNQIVMSGGTSSPGWSTATYPVSTTANEILYSSSDDVIVGLPTATGGVLTTHPSTGVPSIDTTNFVRLSTGMQFKGNNTNTAPPAGFIGEQISSFVAQGSAVALTSGAGYSTITSITLTPGIWDASFVSGVYFTTAGTGTLFVSGIATATNSNTGHVIGDNAVETGYSAVSGVAGQFLCLPGYRILVSSNTTYYLTTRVVFAGGTMSGWGRLTGVRVG